MSEEDSRVWWMTSFRAFALSQLVLFLRNASPPWSGVASVAAHTSKSQKRGLAAPYVAKHLLCPTLREFFVIVLFFFLPVSYFSCPITLFLQGVIRPEITFSLLLFSHQDTTATVCLMPCSGLWISAICFSTEVK